MNSGFLLHWRRSKPPLGKTRFVLCIEDDSQLGLDHAGTAIVFPGLCILHAMRHGWLVSAISTHFSDTVPARSPQGTSFDVEIL